MRQKLLASALLLIALAPQPTAALSLPQVLGYVEILVGFFLAISLVVYAGALIVYFIRLGTVHRAETFHYMYFSIATAFVLAVLLALIHFFEEHPWGMYIAVAIVVLILLIWLATTLKETKKKEARPERG